MVANVIDDSKSETVDRIFFFSMNLDVTAKCSNRLA